MSPPCATFFQGLIQVAGVHDVAEALEIAAAGAGALGLPLRLPVNRPDCGEAEAAAIVAALPPGITPVLITYETDPQALLALCALLGVAHVQLHACGGAAADAALLQRLKVLRPELCLIKSLIVGRYTPEELAAQVAACTPFADAFITDSFDPTSGATGATGQVHDWVQSRALVELSPRPLLLAGGLTPANVAQAVAAVRPAGVDAHTGLESPRLGGRKDPALVRAFVQAARQALRAVHGSGGDYPSE